MEELPKYVYCLPFFCSVIAFTLLFVGTGCHFVQFTTDDESANIQFGLWYYESWTLDESTSTVAVGSCDLYPADGTVNIDNNWQAARVFSLIAIILGGSVLLLDMFQGCMSTKKRTSFRTGAVGYFVCFLSAALSFVFLASNVCKDNGVIEHLNQALTGAQFDEKCSISKGGKSTIAATVLFFAASVGTALLHPAPKKERKSDDGLDEPLFNDESNIL